MLSLTNSLAIPLRTIFLTLTSQASRGVTQRQLSSVSQWLSALQKLTLSSVFILLDLSTVFNTELSYPPLHPLRAGFLRLCTSVDRIPPARQFLSGDVERICFCTTYSHYWCPPRLRSRPSPLLSIHEVTRHRHILTWSLLSLLCG